MGRKSGLLGGIVSVFLLSIVIFFVLYFLMPDVSEKFFGFSKNQAYGGLKDSNAVSELPEIIEKSDKEANDEINSFLSSGSDGSAEVVSAIQKAAAKAGVSVSEYLKSDKGRQLFDSARDFIKKGAGTASDFFTEGEGHKIIEGLSR